ncbi:cytochrome P450 [Streptomyces sp.]|uniref:cytochrome P450 n=1 Tax=Streptomyces sp. TaxID=1931 RepID=UPI002D548069|nr:cytochrome P450 [Streptomyces sp.]HZF88366.1 cytochrome P450 [Streptomyces sp.]
MAHDTRPDTLARNQPLAFPFGPGRGLEPHPAYARLREQPVARVRLPHGQDAWLATRYTDVRTVLSDPRFSLAEAVGRDRPRTEANDWDQVGLMSLDPPGHTRLRSLMTREFSARRIGRLTARVRRAAEQLLDHVVASGPRADLVGQFAVPLPLTLNCELFGVPPEHSRFRDWVERIVFASTVEELTAQTDEWAGRVAELLDLRRANLGEDPLSSLLRAHDRDRTITEEELLALVTDLVAAGFVTVTGQIAASLYHLLTRPEALVRLSERPEQVPAAVEELLRYVDLLDFTAPRYATQDVELGGVLVRAGEPVITSLAAANRDAAVFPHADDLVLDRAGAPHLGFGHGVHFCLGAHLARLELRTALEAALRRLPGLRLAVPEEDLRWRTGGIANGLHELPVLFDAHRAPVAGEGGPR